MGWSFQRLPKLIAARDQRGRYTGFYWLDSRLKKQCPLESAQLAMIGPKAIWKKFQMRRSESALSLKSLSSS
jgi:hypothetical protein